MADKSYRRLPVTLVTVVDAAMLLEDFSSAELLRERGISFGESDERALVDLVTEQIELANVIVLNKTDRLAPHDRRMAWALVRTINPIARILENRTGEVPAGAILDISSFDFDQSQSHASGTA